MKKHIGTIILMIAAAIPVGIWTVGVVRNVTYTPQTQLDRDLSRCKKAGMKDCHIERDTDGTRSVYGHKP